MSDLDQLAAGIPAEEDAKDADEPPSKEACCSARSVLRDAWRIHEVSTDQAVAYSTLPRSTGAAIQNVLLSRMCSGSEAFDAAPRPAFELVVVSATSNTRVLVGKYWVSDGTVISSLTEAEYAQVTGMFLPRRLSGYNQPRARFEESLRNGELNRMAAQEMRRRVQDPGRRPQGMSSDCDG